MVGTWARFCIPIVVPPHTALPRPWIAQAGPLSKLAEEYWAGEHVALDSVHPLTSPHLGVWEAMQPRLAFVFTFGNVTAIGRACGCLCQS
jgi:hypothetical protein